MRDYDALAPSEKATFTYRMVEKVSKFLDDVEEVNRVLETIPFKSQKKAFKEEHIDLVFDLVERVLTGRDVAPVVGGNPLNPDDATKQYSMKAFAVREVDGRLGRYSTTRPASPEEIATNAHLQERISRLSRFVHAPDGIPGPEFRPREYFDGLVEQAEKSGLRPIFEEEGPGLREDHDLDC